MQKTEPNYSIRDLADVHVPVAIVQGEHDEFIKLEHAEYLALSVPVAERILLPGCQPFRTTAKAREIQQRDAGFPARASFLKERLGLLMLGAFSGRAGGGGRCHVDSPAAKLRPAAIAHCARAGGIDRDYSRPM